MNRDRKGLNGDVGPALGDRVVRVTGLLIWQVTWEQERGDCVSLASKGTTVLIILKRMQGKEGLSVESPS